MQTEEQKCKKRKKVLKILAALMGVFLLIGCCSVGGLMFLGSNEPAAVPVPAALATTKATRTPHLTYTPAPTVTLTPTSVPVDDTDAKYIDESIALLVRYDAAMTDLGEWATSGSSYPTFAEWAAEASPKLAELLIVGEGIRELQPSPRFAKSHGVFCEATEHYDAAAQLIAKGIDTLNSDFITEAVTEMTLGTALIEEATMLLPD